MPANPPDEPATGGGPSDLRRRAEERRRTTPPAPIRALGRAEMAHELDVQRVELELQDEELRETHAALRASRDRYQQLFHLAPVGYLTLDRAGTILEANRAFAELVAADPSQLKGKHLGALLTRDEADTFHLHLQEVFESETAAGCRLHLRQGALGAQVPVRLESRPAIGPTAGGGRLCRTVVVDLSELEIARSSRERTEQRLEWFARHIDEVLYVREGGELVYLSPAWTAIWGRAVATLAEAARWWLDGLHPDDRERVSHIHARLQGGEPCDEEYRVLRPDGSTRWVRERARAVDDRGRIIGLVTDVTVERSLQAELREARRLETIGALAGGITHDFNNLLTGVIGCIQRAQLPGLPPDESRGYLRRAEQAALRGRQLVARLLSGGVGAPEEPEVIEADRAMAETKVLLELSLGDPVRLVLSLGAPGIGIPMSHVDLEHVLLNLGRNAREAMSEGGTFTLATAEVDLDAAAATRLGLRRPGRYVHLRAGDTGCGMDAQTQTKIFEPRFTTKAGGTGRGLATAQATILRAGGAIRVRSEPGAGTTFDVHLPGVALPAPGSPPSPAAPVALGGAVLLVEDEPLVRLTVRHFLQELGFRVVEAVGPNEAAELAQRVDVPIDFLVADMSMPGGSGPVLAARLCAANPRLKVLIISAHPRATLVRQGRLPDGMALLEKPFTQEELAGALQRLLVEGAPIAAPSPEVTPSA